MAETTEPSLADRGWWTLAALSLLGLAIQLSQSATTFPVLGLVSAVLGAAGVATLALTWTSLDQPALAKALPWAVLALVVGAIAAVGVVQLFATPGYGTDEIAFDQYAAQLALHGHNPYLHSMGPAFPLFHVSPNGYTFHLDGSPVTALSYPALSFLLYVPLLALGWHTQLAIVVNLFAWLLATVLVFLMLPRRMAPLAIVVGSLGIFVTSATGGVTDALFVPLLVIAAFRWDRFAEGPWWRTAYGPIALGLAMCVKQTPWLVLPLMLAALWRITAANRGWRNAIVVPLRYAALSLAALIIPNLPYIVGAPRAWWDHVTTPLAGNIVPAGQGLVGLSLYLHAGGGDLRWYSALSLVIFAGLLVAVLIGPTSLTQLSFILPSVVLFFAARSFGNYLTALIPAAIVGLVTASRSVVAPAADPANPPTSSEAQPWLPSRLVRTCLLGGFGALCLGLAVAALTVRSPLSVHVVGIRTTGQLATVDQISVEATNSSHHAIRPSFTLDQGGNLTAFWRVVSGPSSVAPGTTARFTIEAPNFYAQPPLSGFQVLAFSSGPPAVSHTTAFIASTMHVSITPNAINHPVRVGDEVHVQAQLMNRINRPIRRADVPIYLTQVIYAQAGLQYATTRINNGHPGQTPVIAKTDSAGMATFVLKATEPDTNAVYYEASLRDPTRGYPFGYSQTLAVRYDSPTGR